MISNNPIQKIEVLNLEGKLVRVLNSDQEKSLKVDRSRLLSGIYVLHVHAGKVFTRKLCVKGKAKRSPVLS